MKNRQLAFLGVVMWLSLNRPLRHALWAHSALAMVIALVFGCSDDAETHQALERDNSDPMIAQGGWYAAIPYTSSGRASLAGAGGVPSVAGSAFAIASLPVASASTGGASQLPAATSTTASNTAGSANAIGGQPNTAPTSSAVAIGGTGTIGTGGTTTNIAGSGGIAGNATTTVQTGGATSTRVYPVETGPDTPVRVLFESLAGTPSDTTVQVMVRLENRSQTDVFPLKDIEVTYWGTMATIKSITCICDTTVCGAATVGTFRTSHGQANCGFIYRFPGFELQPAKSIVLSWNCHYSDWTAIDESTHYSYPFGMTQGDPMPRVTVIDKAKQVVLWGVLPE